jgi:predicted HD superfamily hydrolase involved in NAD metabolism
LTGDLEAALTGLPGGLLRHIDRVVHEARRLAHLHHVDERRVVLAARMHDVLRAASGDDLLRLARDLGVEVGPIERLQPVLLHGPAGARLLERDFGLSDSDVLAAVASHTTARPEMGLLEQVVFVADKIEPRKVSRRPDLAEMREIASSDLEEAILFYLGREQVRAAERGWLLHPDSVAARNSIILKRAA